MKQTFLLIIFIAWTTISFGQEIEKADSIKIIESLERIFENFSNPDYEKFELISSSEIYCIFCDGKENSDIGPNMIDRKEFFDKYLKNINGYEFWKRAKKKNDLILINENNKWSDITIFITIWEKDEIENGHEGGQLVLYFKRRNEEFIFSGFETMP